MKGSGWILLFCLFESVWTDHKQITSSRKRRQELVEEDEWIHSSPKLVYVAVKESAFWPQKYKKCGGKRQSPIDIAHVEYEEMEEFIFSREFYNVQNMDIVLKNTGYTVELVVNTMVPVLTGGGLNHRYRFKQMHFHWGQHYGEGSEHAVNGVKFPGEIHFVFYRETSHHNPPSSSDPDDIAVLAAFIELTDKSNKEYDFLLHKIRKIRYQGSVHISQFPGQLRTLFPDSVKTYFRYYGSLTTPPCTENVVWTVFEHTIKLTREQMSVFRNLHRKPKDDFKNPKIASNYRKLQKRNLREISTNDPRFQTDSSKFQQN